MKLLNNIQIYLACIIIFIIAFASCKKEDNTPQSTTGSLLFHLHTFVDTTEVNNYSDTLLLVDGRRITVSTAQLYLSNIKLIKLDGTILDAPSTIVFLKQGIEEYEIGNVPTGNYKSVRFDVGLSDSLNASAPGTSDQILYQPTMWFGASAQPDGFVFINFQGRIDTTNSGTATNLIPFVYKIGTIAHRMTVTMPDQNYTVISNQQSVRHILANYSKLFEGISISNNSNLHIETAAQNANPISNKVAANILNMFQYEE